MPASAQRLPSKGKAEEPMALELRPSGVRRALRVPIERGVGPRCFSRKRKIFRLGFSFLVAAILAAARPAGAATPLPPAPARWVTDAAGVLSPDAAAAIDRQLEAFEKEQGTQLLVVIETRLPADEVLEDWTQRVAESWGVGRAKEDDGAVLFVFVEERALRLEVGYGLEGTLTDLESKAILDEVLVPHLRRGDWDGGIAAAAEAIVAAVRGDFESEAGARRGGTSVRSLGCSFFVFLLVSMVVLLWLSSRAVRRGGVRTSGWGGGRGGGWRGGGFGGGGFGGGGFGGFSGGGGSFGGGGASGRW